MDKEHKIKKSSGHSVRNYFICAPFVTESRIKTLIRTIDFIV